MTTRASICKEVFVRSVRLDPFMPDSGVIFSNGVEEELGLPDIGTMQEFCRKYGFIVSHIGMGCFEIRRYGHVAAHFFGGTAMNCHRDENGDYLVASSSVDFKDPGVKVLWDLFIEGLPGVADCELEASMGSELIDGRW